MSQAKEGNMSLLMQENLNHLDDASEQDAATALYRILKGLRIEVRRMALDEMDVRLVSDENGALQVNTGDVQFDTHHGAACSAGAITSTSTDDELLGTAEQLVRDVCDQLADLE